MAYAEGTTVSPERSQAEIAELLRKYGAAGFSYGWDNGKAQVAFKAHDRIVRFTLPLPDPNDRAFAVSASGRKRDAGAAYEAEIRRRWRALALAIKAKLECVSTGITTFEDEFMAHIVLPDGRTVSEHVSPRIEQAYSEGLVASSLLAIGGQS
jgi:hypothetical protein